MSEWVSIKDRYPSKNNLIPMPLWVKVCDPGFVSNGFFLGRESKSEIWFALWTGIEDKLFVEFTGDTTIHKIRWSFRQLNDFEIENVTHWIPLPKPPEVGDE